MGHESATAKDGDFLLISLLPDVCITPTKSGESVKVGQSILVMKADGSITLNGKTIDVVGTSHIGLESERIDMN